MLSALAAADVVTWTSILVKTFVYATTLLAAGGVLCLAMLRSLAPADRRFIARAAVLAAVVAAALSLLRLPIRASFLMGGTWDGADDPMLLEMVAESPLGDAVLLRLLGLALVAVILVPGRMPLWIAAAGAVICCASFAVRGHALEAPLVGGLVTLHLLGLAFWVGVFLPLHRAAGRADPKSASTLAEEFGRKGLWVVAALVVAGGGTLVLLVGVGLAALDTAYGQLFVFKLALFAGVLSLAALNKLRLTPALALGTRGAGQTLQRSIRWEAALIAGALLTTATLTTVTAP